MTEKKNRPAASKLSYGWKVALNILLMFVAALFLGWLGTFILDFWTHHGDKIEVPDVRGLSFDDATEALERQDFEVVLQDSVYDDHAARGAVVEQNPRFGAVVKPGRTIYLTINAFCPRTVMVPSLVDISVRQARSTLDGLGLNNYIINIVPSEYKDLVLSVVYEGKRLVPGTRVPLDAMIILEVGQGPVEAEYMPEESDSDAAAEPTDAEPTASATESPEEFFD